MDDDLHDDDATYSAQHALNADKTPEQIKHEREYMILNNQIQYYAINHYYAPLKQVCTDALHANPSDIHLQFWHSYALSKQGCYDSCISSLDRLRGEKDLALPVIALLLTAHNSKPSREKNKSVLLELKGQLKAVSKSSNESSLKVAGQYFLFTNKIPKARQCIEKLLSKNKKNMELLNLFGWIYLMSNEDKYFEKSMHLFRKVMKMSSPNFDISALMGRAKFLELDGKPSKALSELDTIIKLYPTFSPAYSEKSRLLFLTSRFRDGFSLPPQPMDVTHDWGRIYEAAINKGAKFEDEYDAYMSKLKEVEPGNIELYHTNLELFTQLSRHSTRVLATSLELALLCVSLKSSNASYLYQAALLQSLTGKHEDADKATLKINELLAGDEEETDNDLKVQVHNLRVWNYLRAKNFDAAKKLVDENVDQSKEHYYAQASIAHSTRNTSVALKCLTEALDHHMSQSKQHELSEATKYWNVYKPLLIVHMAQLYWDIVGVQYQNSFSLTLADIPPVHSLFLTVFKHFHSIVPGDENVILHLILFYYTQGAESEYMSLLNKEYAHPPLLALIRHLKQQAGMATTPAKAAAPVVAAKAAVVPSSEARRQFKQTLQQEEWGLDSDDEVEDKIRELGISVDDDEIGRQHTHRAAEEEANTLLREMEMKSEAERKVKEDKMRQEQKLRLEREALQRKTEELLSKQAEEEARLALDKRKTKQDELKKQQEIEALRKAREDERRRQQDELDRAERDREEQRERERLAMLRENVSVVQELKTGNGPLKWNTPHDYNPLSPPAALSGNANTGALPTPLSLQTNAPTPTNANANANYPPTSFLRPSPSASTQGMTAQQIAHQNALQAQRSEEARALAEKKQRIMAAGEQIEQAKKFTKAAFWGEVFLKHGRRGSPHERNVTLEVTGSDLKFDWSSGQLKANKNEIQLFDGKHTEVFKRPTASKTKPELCFSIVTATRSLDLEATNQQTKEYWVHGITLLLKYLK